MDASPSKPSVPRASPSLCEPRSPSTASVLAKETRDGARGSSGVQACIPPTEAACSLRKRLRSALPEDGGDAKRSKDVGNVVVPDTAALNDGGQFQLASAGPESLLFSFPPSGAARDMVLGPSGSVHGVQPMRSFELDGTKHKIFLSHAGAQKDFVEQLCVDLERKGYLFPFFDQRHHSLPKGEDFAPLIIKAAGLCHVAVIVLSEDFLCSKWPMIELAEFYKAQQGARGGGGKLNLLPSFLKLSIEEVEDEGRWMPKWKEYAKDDDRIHLPTWSVAVKALCKSNGLEFGKVATKEVAYRVCVVESIFKLSPPDLLFGSSESMVGFGRMCEVVSTQFMEDTTIGARVLGIYGMAGLGKSMLAKTLHDYFYGDFLGKVCYVDMRHGSRARCQKQLLKVLCGFEKDVVACIGFDVEKGLEQMKAFLNLNPVFLILDNITCDRKLLQEVKAYLKMRFHPKSRILITSSSKAILEDLLPNMEFFTPMPTLMVEEARELFLKGVAPMKALCELTSEEQTILGICIQKCWFASEEGEKDGFYHPVALIALADFFSRLGRAKGNQFLVWKNHLENDKDLVKDVLKSSKDLFGILGLQFSTFDFREKLVFLDLALYFGDNHYWKVIIDIGFDPLLDDLDWLCRLHDESQTSMRIKLSNLRKSGMIDSDHFREDGSPVWCYIQVSPLYKEFAKWYAMDHNVNGLKSAWGVFQLGGMNLEGDSLTTIKSWSNLIRLRIDPMTHANAQLVASKRLQELSNLVVLHLSYCENLTTLNLEGLHCLRDLELYDLPKLKTITLLGNSSKDEYTGIYDTLQHVRFMSLVSLVDMPDLRPCTSLHLIALDKLQELENIEGVDCPFVKVLILLDVSSNHFERILDFDCFQSLEKLAIEAKTEVGYRRGTWERINSEIWPGFAFEGKGPCGRFFKELCLLLGISYNMICTNFEREIISH